jgi:hypothetical protein
MLNLRPRLPVMVCPQDISVLVIPETLQISAAREFVRIGTLLQHQVDQIQFVCLNDPLLPVATVRFAANRQPKGGWS